MSFALVTEPMLSRSPLDRAEELRKDSAALTAGWPTASVLRVDPVGRVPVTDGAVGMVPAAEVADAPPSDAVFLGRADGRHLWAIPVESLDGETTDLRSFGDVLTESSAGVVVTAVALLNWHRSARFSARDGSPTRMSAAGWSRVSEATGHEEWPRSDPAIIVLVHDGADRVLLARQPTWPERRMSVLAGFVEAGESLESCVVREVREEVGLDVTGIEYLGSQPWPFPRSIMIGFAARADPDAALAFTDGEIAEARWFHRSDVEAALAAGDWAASTSAPLLLPGSISIARAMLESWIARP